MVLKKIEKGKIYFICEACNMEYGGEAEKEYRKIAKKCEESCKKIGIKIIK